MREETVRRSNRKFETKRRLLAAIAVIAFAALPGCGEKADRRESGGFGRAAIDPCQADPRSLAAATPDSDFSGRGLLSRLYPADSARHPPDDETPLRVHSVRPGELAAMASVDGRKAAFITVVLPMIHRVNQEILHDRRLVEIALACDSDRRPIGRGVRAAIAKLHDRYRTEGDLASLRQRLDIVPPSLAIAQAAIESGWGTSRFAVHGNALFGQRTTNRDRGIRPANLPPTTPVRVAYFDHLMASVRSYVHNLNTHPAYRKFRDRRAALRRNGNELDGLTLAGTLIAYSSRGPAYVRDLKSIIRGNRLATFDSASGAASLGGLTPGSDT